MTLAAEHTTVKDLAGKVALVVGGTQHMALAVAEEIAARGATVTVSYGHDEAAAEAAVKRLRGLGAEAQAVAADATDTDATVRLFDRVIADHGRLDLVVHMPGRIVKKPLVDITDDEFDGMMAANARSAFLTLREAGRRVADGGRIVVFSTTLTVPALPQYGVYAGAKAAAELMVRAMAKEVAGRGITVNVVAPGPVDTPFYHGQESAEAQAGAIAFTPMGRLGQPSDVVPLVGFLLTDRAGWITGQVIRPNGGMAS